MLFRLTTVPLCGAPERERPHRLTRPEEIAGRDLGIAAAANDGLRSVVERHHQHRKKQLTDSDAGILELLGPVRHELCLTDAGVRDKNLHLRARRSAAVVERERVPCVCVDAGRGQAE